MFARGGNQTNYPPQKWGEGRALLSAILVLSTGCVCVCVRACVCGVFLIKQWSIMRTVGVWGKIIQEWNDWGKTRNIRHNDIRILKFLDHLTTVFQTLPLHSYGSLSCELRRSGTVCSLLIRTRGAVADSFFRNRL